MSQRVTAVILHNDGEKITKWELLLPGDFSSNKTEGVLESNASEQILITFFPKERREYSKYAILKYDGEEAHVNLIGKAINGNVFLSRDSVQMEGTYITLESKSTLRIINKSSVKIDFEWRAFSSEKEDAEKKKLLLDEIENEEKEKYALIREITGYSSGFEDILKNMLDEEVDDLDKDDPGFEDYVEKKKRNAEALIKRKYKILRKEIQEDRLIYDDNIFSIQPQTGSIWPNSELTVTITFKPTDALAYLSGAYCDISCSDERLALHLEGEGVGPKAFLSTNVLNIGGSHGASNGRRHIRERGAEDQPVHREQGRNRGVFQAEEADHDVVEHDHVRLGRGQAGSVPADQLLHDLQVQQNRPIHRDLPVAAAGQLDSTHADGEGPREGAQVRV